MTYEVTVTVLGHEHVLRGARAKRFLDIMAKKLADNPELQHAGRLARQQAEHDAFRESEQPLGPSGAH